jgi:hypothetical protein
MDEKTAIDSFLFQRRMIGIFGIILGFVCIAVGQLQSTVIQPSISEYYYTNARDVLVGVLVASAFFLFSYKGYDKIDDTLSSISAWSALGVGLFPCRSIGITYTGILSLPVEVSNVFHFLSAFVFFVSLTYTNLFLFTRTNGIVSINKVKRNAVYYLTSAFMIVGTVVIVLGAFISALHPFVLVSEIIMLCSYGIAWLVKGRTLLKD